MEQARSALEQQYENMNVKLRDLQVSLTHMDNQFKSTSTALFEQEGLTREEKSSLELGISDLKFKMSKALNENEEVKRKIDTTNQLFQETFKDNENIVREFEEFKRHQLANIGQKENDVNSLKTGTF